MRIYDKKRWQRLRRYQLAIRPLCRVCGKSGNHVDHVIPVSMGGEPWDLQNLQTLCHEHHSVKTASERTDGMWYEKIGEDGCPIGGTHWWSQEDVEPEQKPKKDEWTFD